MSGYGEIWSANIVTELLRQEGLPFAFLNARDVLLVSEPEGAGEGRHRCMYVCMYVDVCMERCTVLNVCMGGCMYGLFILCVCMCCRYVGDVLYVCMHGGGCMYVCTRRLKYLSVCIYVRMYVCV